MLEPAVVGIMCMVGGGILWMLGFGLVEDARDEERKKQLQNKAPTITVNKVKIIPRKKDAKIFKMEEYNFPQVLNWVKQSNGEVLCSKISPPPAEGDVIMDQKKSYVVQSVKSIEKELKMLKVE